MGFLKVMNYSYSVFLSLDCIGNQMSDAATEFPPYTAAHVVHEIAECSELFLITESSETDNVVVHDSTEERPRVVWQTQVFLCTVMHNWRANDTLFFSAYIFKVLSLKWVTHKGYLHIVC